MFSACSADESQLHCEAGSSIKIDRNKDRSRGYVGTGTNFVNESQAGPSFKIDRNKDRYGGTCTNKLMWPRANLLLPIFMREDHV